jgi:uncharacterized repeat protein (TIGR01451 family)
MPWFTPSRRAWLSFAVVLLFLTPPFHLYASAAAPAQGDPALPAPSTVANLPPAFSDPPALELAIDDGLNRNQIAKPSDRITYTLTFTNTGDSSALNVQLAAPVPLHTQFVGDADRLWTCRATVDALASPICRMGIGNLAPHDQQQVNFTVLVDDPLPADVTTILLEAAANADNVVCGECGMATIATPVDPDLGQYGRQRVYIPQCARR